MKYKELIPVANTYLGEEEAKAAYDVVKSGWVSTGPKVKEFEENFAKKVGANNAIAANNGTAALHAAIAALDIKTGDEVIIPSLTFISTANAVLYQNAKPVLIDVNPKTYNTTVDDIKNAITEKTKAIIPVDMMGMPVEYDEILDLAEENSIPIISDSAESLGATYKNKKVGSIASIHIFSFFPNKNITTGEGGMITTSNEELAEELRRLINQGQDYRYHHVVLGYNYRMNNIQGAIGNEQLKRLDFVIKEKQAIADKYNKAFTDCKNISIPYLPPYVTQHSWYMYTISVKSNRDKIVEELENRNIQTRLSFPPIHIQPFYKDMYGYTEQSLPKCYDSWSKLINIPIWPQMGDDRLNFIIDTLIEICE